MVSAVDKTPDVVNESIASESQIQPEYQRTLSNGAIAQGIGLHLGQQTTVRLLPAEVDEGRYFVRTDLSHSLSDSTRIEATVAQVIATQLSTELGVGKAQVRTVEHLLSALIALDIDNVRIEIDGPELPLLDGSALGWIEAILRGGDAADALHYSRQSALKKRRQPVQEIVAVRSGDAWVTAYPDDNLRFSYGIDFDLAAIGNQWHSWSPAQASFVDEVAPARTFGLAHQIDYLRSQGLIKGGSLDNALVCGQAGWLNPPLRFKNEPARHKLLDLLGDLSLLGDIPSAHYVAYKASHALHVELAKKLLAHCPFQN